MGGFTPNSVQLHALRWALEFKGDADSLAARLGVPAERVRIWLQGDAPIPDAIFLLLVDILAENGYLAAAPPGSAPSAMPKRAEET